MTEAAPRRRLDGGNGLSKGEHTMRAPKYRRPAWLRRSLEQGKRYPWLVAVKELAR